MAKGRRRGGFRPAFTPLSRMRFRRTRDEVEQQEDEEEEVIEKKKGIWGKQGGWAVDLSMVVVRELVFSDSLVYAISSASLLYALDPRFSNVLSRYSIALGGASRVRV